MGPRRVQGGAKSGSAQPTGGAKRAGSVWFNDSSAAALAAGTIPGGQEPANRRVATDENAVSVAAKVIRDWFSSHETQKVPTNAELLELARKASVELKGRSALIRARLPRGTALSFVRGVDGRAFPPLLAGPRPAFLGGLSAPLRKATGSIFAGSQITRCAFRAGGGMGARAVGNRPFGLVPDHPMSAIDDMEAFGVEPQAGDLTVGTWNVLLPENALKYGDLPEGVTGQEESTKDDGTTMEEGQGVLRFEGLRLKTDKPYVAGGPMGMELTGGSQQDRVAMKARLLKVPPRESNWPARAREISKRLLEAKLDIYLLQEVGEKELDDLCHGSLGEMYEAVHTVHPGRGAKGEHRVTTDGVAILLRRARLRLEGREHVEFMAGKAGFEGEVHQHALLATARDIETGAQVLVACVHFDKKSNAPRPTLLAALDARTAPAAGGPDSLPPSLVVWGGSCNTEGGVYRTAPGGEKTHARRNKKVDWVFAGGAEGVPPQVLRSVTTQVRDPPAPPCAARGRTPLFDGTSGTLA
ncbi:hypothetical protein T484DRAFT_1773451 [Baffinella frigidus]|nr:hypothetical protein T484DRAFT_1773451 [Cryptophyta sp. CCMP2293]